MILRQSTTYTIPAAIIESSGWSEGKILQYRFNMVSPVAQGYAEKGLTRFIIAFSGAFPTEHNTDTPSDSENESDSEGIEIDEGFLAVGSSSLHSSTLDPLFQARPLPEVNGKYPGDHVVYLSVSDFGRVGLLNGDWGIIHANDVSRRRLVRVYTDPSDSRPTGVITGAPMLLCNISEGFDYSTKSFSLLTSPFGSLEPNIPIARSATIARVATPISTDRSYQPLFLYALKQYFEGKKRLVKEGDLIALEIDTDLSWRIADAQKTEVSSPDDDEPSSTYPCTPPRANEVVFFMITHIEHPAITNGIDTHDIAYESAAGELGFWIDSTVTRIVQTGLEHTRIPDIGPSTPDNRDPRSLLATISKQHSTLLSVGSPFDQLRSVLSATFADFAVDYNLDLSVLLQGARGTGKSTVARWVAQRLGFNILEINCYNLLGENDTKTEGVLRTRFDKAIQCAPCILFLKHVDALAQTTQVLETGKDPAIVTALKECVEQAQGSWRTMNFPVVVLGTTSEPSKVPGSILALFKHQISFEAPNEAERYEILNALLDGAMLAPDVSLASIATQTAALVASDLASLVARARHVSLENVPNVTLSADQSDIPLTASDFDVALNKARASYSDAIGAPRIPTVTWDDVGGLAHVKSDILDTIQLPLEHPELFADGLKKRSGILLYGPPGTGKTLLAKAVATSCSLNFFSVKGPELLNMYIGESEANVRRVFQRARDARPCVIFFDELDSVAPKRGNHGDSGGVMDRIVSQLLAELDGMSSGKGGSDVFVIGATNRPDLLDPALLRPGRFDRMLYLGVSDTHEAQSNILEALTRKFRLHPDLNLKEVAERCPFNYTGADFYALCSDAMLGAMSRKAEELEAVISKLNEAPEMAAPEEIDVLVTKEDFDVALKNLVPSVSQSEMEHYARVQQRFSQKSDS
ncbi:peroxisomal assembly protein [Pleurotus pulmonarius]|nr:peroxisomal assembly protein [Pleurotus pulmonarius]KAF4603984.1 peroxisomal assembly protein [Pleurotus pulmonarius]KAF4608812.1 peroxisomal assembly protein [Pleurotus pulmonarius]